MSSAYSQQIETLLDALMRAERHADLVKKFAETGGAHRIRIQIEHPDYEVRESVERVANEYIPAEVLLRGFERWAKQSVEQARMELAVAATLTSVTSESRSAA